MQDRQTELEVQGFRLRVGIDNLQAQHQQLSAKYQEVMTELEGIIKAQQQAKAKVVADAVANDLKPDCGCKSAADCDDTCGQKKVAEKIFKNTTEAQ